MSMFARFDENLAMTLQDIKETKRYGRTDGRTDTRTDNLKTVYPPQTKFAGGGGGYNNAHGMIKETLEKNVCFQVDDINTANYIN